VHSVTLNEGGSLDRKQRKLDVAAFVRSLAFSG
jgi:hypothetical protein